MNVNPAVDLREATRSLCAPRSTALGPRPEPSDELLQARRHEPLKKDCAWPATWLWGRGPACSRERSGAMIGSLTGLIVTMPLLIMARNASSKTMSALMVGGLAVGILGGIVGGGLLGWHVAGSGLSLGSAALGASAVFMGTASGKLRRLEDEHKEQLESWETGQQALARGEQPPPPLPPLEAPSAIEELGNMILVGGIRLPNKRRRAAEE